MDERKTLAEISVGERCEINSLSVSGAIRRRLFDLGFAPGEEVLCIGRSPFGDPRAYNVRGGTVAIRRGLARLISVCDISTFTKR